MLRLNNLILIISVNAYSFSFLNQQVQHHCNPILLWTRFGHGAFLVCLEELYKKITGRDLIYTALIGKPSELTMAHADAVAQKQAKAIGLENSIKRIYFVG